MTPEPQRNDLPDAMKRWALSSRCIIDKSLARMSTKRRHADNRAGIGRTLRRWCHRHADLPRTVRIM